MNVPFALTPPDHLVILDESSPRAQPARPVDVSRLAWELSGMRVDLGCPSPQRMTVSVVSTAKLICRLFLRWNYVFPAAAVLLGDAWERSYGDLEWRGHSPHRPLPWYFLFTDGVNTTGLGVETGASSMACWRTDADGISLELDVRCGGAGVRLNKRVLHAATIIHHPPQPGETPYAATRSFCAALCPSPLVPAEPVIGHNDWHWLYGNNSAEQILEATRRIVDLYPSGGTAPRPWSVIDDGWQAAGPDIDPLCHGGPWKQGTAKFPDMPGLAGKIIALGARPGIWLRPLLTHEAVPETWKIHSPKPSCCTSGHALDPSVPKVLDLVRADFHRLSDWGYELIKHDFSTFDITGRWGFEMNGSKEGVTSDGWSFSDRSRTTAEIILDFYRAIREAAGPGTTLIGCNTMSHLVAGLVEMQRIGDDTSASDWDRTRRMGVNTLAFRSAQHGTFYAADADCVPVTPHVPWSLTQSWLDLISGSGTPLFLSIDPAACGPEQIAALKRAVALALKSPPLAEPLDWMHISERYPIGEYCQPTSPRYGTVIGSFMTRHQHEASFASADGAA